LGLGLAGSVSLVVLTATTLENPIMMIGFILVFEIYSVIDMSLVNSLMGLPISVIFKVSAIHKSIQYVAGAFSFLIGVNIMYEIGILGNLFGIF
jgi:hypothetical protein